MSAAATAAHAREAERAAARMSAKGREGWLTMKRNVFCAAQVTRLAHQAATTRRRRALPQALGRPLDTQAAAAVVARAQRRPCDAGEKESEYETRGMAEANTHFAPWLARELRWRHGDEHAKREEEGAAWALRMASGDRVRYEDAKAVVAAAECVALRTSHPPIRPPSSTPPSFSFPYNYP